MYQDAGLGDNWQPEGNNARRFDPYTRSCAALASLFAIGFVLIIIIVLSLIPIYISHKSASTNSNIQTSKIFINNYNLQLQSPFDSFNPQTILSDANNRLTLQAALTAILQTDSTTIGSVIEINSPTIRSSRKRRQISNLSNLIFNFDIISNTSCSAIKCLNQFHSNIIRRLSNPTQTTSFIRYQESNNTQIYWLSYRLPQTIQSNASLVFVDLKTITALLNTLLLVDRTENQPSIENSTTNVTT